jgi:hypothetical protein
VGATVLLVNSAYTSVNEVKVAGLQVTDQMIVESEIELDGNKYDVINPNDLNMALNVRFLADKDTGEIEKQMEYGIGSKGLPAPQATLMATVIRGLLEQKLPWALVLFGIAITIMVEFCGVKGLPFAVGLYLPVSITTPILFGGFFRWLIDSKFRKPVKGEDPEAAPGTLFSSGLIAGGAIAGLLIAILTGFDLSEALKIGPKILGSLVHSNLFAVLFFALMLGTLFYIATGRNRKK